MTNAAQQNLEPKAKNLCEGLLFININETKLFNINQIKVNLIY